MTKQARPRFDPALKIEAVQLVPDQGYSIKEVAYTMGIGITTLDNWDRKLKK